MPDSGRGESNFFRRCVPHATLHPAKPVTMGAFAMSDYFTEIMKAKDEALKNSKKVNSGRLGRVG